MFLLSFFLVTIYISEVLTFPIDTTHGDIVLAFDCFAFFFMGYTLRPPYGVEDCAMFSYDII